MSKLHAELLDKQCLTDRESQVLQLVCEGAPDKVIAAQLAISIKTVTAHLDHIYLKLQIQNQQINTRCVAIGIALVRGMVRLTTTALCVWLMVGAVSLDDNALRVSARVTATRLKGRDA